MAGFNDATCPKCRTRFGWFGKLIDKPDCPKCGNKPDKEALAKLEKEIEDTIEEDLKDEEISS